LPKQNDGDAEEEEENEVEEGGTQEEVEKKKWWEDVVGWVLRNGEFRGVGRPVGLCVSLLRPLLGLIAQVTPKHGKYLSWSWRLPLQTLYRA
jgi:hypothetical protein